MYSFSVYRTAGDLVDGFREQSISERPQPITEIHTPQAGRVEGVLVVGAASGDRNRVATDRIRDFWTRHPGAPVFHDRTPAGWPVTGLAPAAGFPDEPCAVIVTDIGHAFPNAQTNATRLVLTQSTYSVQKLLDRLAGRPAALVVATADEAELRHGAVKAFDRRGPWARFSILQISGDPGAPTVAPAPEDPGAAGDPEAWLQFAYRTPSPLVRVDACRQATRLADDLAVAHLALGSAYMEQEEFESARRALDRAAALAPDWEAVYFERGKFWLRYDDMSQASDDFARACERMPTFAASFSNLGATLGELDRQAEAVAAFTQALKHDPYGYPVLNNIGVVCREMGRLDESERAFRKVIDMAPDFVFGHYNLGHTLFLQGRFAEAVSAYSEGQRRDPQRNARQASRLALARLAAGDLEGARRDFEACLASVPAPGRADLLMEAQEIVGALITHRPDLVGAKEIGERIAQELVADG